MTGRGGAAGRRVPGGDPTERYIRWALPNIDPRALPTGCSQIGDWGDRFAEKAFSPESGPNRSGACIQKSGIRPTIVCLVPRSVRVVPLGRFADV